MVTYRESANLHIIDDVVQERIIAVETLEFGSYKRTTDRAREYQFLANELLAQARAEGLIVGFEGDQVTVCEDEGFTDDCVVVVPPCSVDPETTAYAPTAAFPPDHMDDLKGVKAISVLLRRDLFDGDDDYKRECDDAARSILAEFTVLPKYEPQEVSPELREEVERTAHATMLEYLAIKDDDRPVNWSREAYARDSFRHHWPRECWRIYDSYIEQECAKR